MISTLAKSSSNYFRERYLALGIGVLLLFYAVGFWGLGFSAYEPWFIALVPFNLLLTNTILFLFHRDWSWSFFLFALTAWTAGFLFEWIGVHTGLLFGEYSYGTALGFKVDEIPLLIGLNWLMLVYSSGHLVQRWASHWFMRALLGAILMVSLDVLIEPVAVRFDFWSWHQNEIPFSNFIGWFLVALLLQIHFHRSFFKKDNPIAPWVLLVQVLFFLGLYLVI